MKKEWYLLLLTCIFTCSGIYGQESPVYKGLQSISEDVIKAQLGFLASDWTEGREAGEKGAFIASDYIASMLQLYGIKPFGDLLPGKGLSDNQQIQDKSYFQNFILLKSVPGDNQVLKVKSQNGNGNKTISCTYNVDYLLFPSYPPVEIEAPVVFAGYGFKNEKIRFNDFNNLNIKGKFVLKITGVPSFIREKLTAAEISNSLKDAYTYIKEAGAVGIIEFSPERLVAGKPGAKDFMNQSPAEHKPVPEVAYASYSLPGKTVSNDPYRVYVSDRTANEILYGTGIVAEDYMKNADANLAYKVNTTSEKSIYLKTDVKTTQVAVRNVIGIIEGKNADQIILLGAHYDHLGMNDGYIWNGADDNGSGTVGVMTLARAIMATGKNPDKTIIIALWTAEEEGLYGSHYFVNNLPFPLKNLKLNVNLDMISRYISDDNPKGVVLTYTQSCSGFKDITETNLKKYGIDIIVDYQPSENPPGGSDHRSFVDAGIPIMRFKTAHRAEYHTPADEVSTLNWDIMEKIIRISFADIWDLANNPW